MKSLKSLSILATFSGVILAISAIVAITRSPFHSTDTIEFFTSTSAEANALYKTENHNYFNAAIQKVSGIFSASTTNSTLQGTNTAVVGLYIDKNGYPQANVQDVTVAPGQRITFVGPNEFEIIFKDQRSPVENLEVRTSNGILMIDIPSDVFSQEDKKHPENRGKNELIYNYGIRVNGKVTDPTIHVFPR
jgi:hypothetical protein